MKWGIRHIEGGDLHPQQAAKTLLQMVPEIIEHLSWVPSEVREGVKLVKRAEGMIG